MKTITRNIGSTIIVVIICLIIYTISMIANPLRINSRLYNGLDSKTVYALSFVNLLGYPENIFKSPLTIEDYEVSIEGDANTVNDSTSSTLVSDGISYTGSLDELKSKVETALGSSSESMVSSKKKVLAEVFIGLMSGKSKDWAYPMSIELASGVLGNTAGEGSSLTVEPIKDSNGNTITFHGDGVIKTWKDMEEAYTSWAGGTGIFGFTSQNIKDGIWKHIKSELDKNNTNYNDKADEGYAARLQTEGFLLMGDDSLKKKIGFFTDRRWRAMVFDFPSSYDGNFKSPTISNNNMYEVYCDWFCYHYERNAASLLKEEIENTRHKGSIPVVDETSNGKGIFQNKLKNSYNNKSRRIFSKAIYDALKSIDRLSNKTVSTDQKKQNGTLSNSNITSVNPGDYVWIGDSRTMQIIVQNQSEFNEHNANKFRDKNMKLVYGIRTVVDEKINQQHKLIMHGVGSGAFTHMNGKNDEYDKDFRKGINDALDKLSNGNIILWFGINQGLSGVTTETIRDGNRYVSLPGPLKDNSWLKNLIDSLDSKNNKLFLVQVYPNYENNGLPYDYTTDNGVTKNYTHLLVNKMFKQLASDKPSRISYVQLWDGVGLSPYSVDNTNVPNDKLHLKPDFGRKILNEVIGRLGLRFK